MSHVVFVLHIYCVASLGWCGETLVDSGAEGHKEMSSILVYEPKCRGMVELRGLSWRSTVTKVYIHYLTYALECTEYSISVLPVSSQLSTDEFSLSSH